MSLRSRLAVLIVAVVAAAAVAVVALLAIRALSDDDQPRILAGSGGDPFRIEYPANWSPLSTPELNVLPGTPLAVLQREGGEGLIVLRRQKPAPPDLEKFASQLDRAFKKRLPGFQRRTARRIRIRAGRALLYSYIRKRVSAAYSVVLVPAGDRSYVLDTVVRGDSPDAAREVGEIVVSFDLAGR